MCPTKPGQHPQQEIEAHFYTDPTVIADFKAYVSSRLESRQYQYTGKRLGDDPTIMAWETGNEIYDAPAGWTQDMASYIKGLAPHTLVSDGSAANGLHITFQRVLDTPAVDIYGGHFYPLDWTWMATDAAQVRAAGKAYYVGEYPATDQSALEPDATSYRAKRRSSRGHLVEFVWTRGRQKLGAARGRVYAPLRSLQQRRGAAVCPDAN